MPPLSGKSYRITAHAVIPESGAQGVIVSYGGRESGFAIYLKDDRLVYENNPLHGAHTVIASDIQPARGKVVLAFEFSQESTSEGTGWSRITSSGTGRLSINGREVGEAKLTATLGAGYDESFGIGQAFGPPVSDVFRPPFRFTGTLIKVEAILCDENKRCDSSESPEPQ